MISINFIYSNYNNNDFEDKEDNNKDQLEIK